MRTEARETDVVSPGKGDVAGIRLYTRGPVTLPWLSEHVVPVARRLHQEGHAVVRIRRGWLGGPHVDVIAYAGVGREPRWLELAREIDAGPLDPATALSEEAYLGQAREFGRLEAVPPPYLPMAEHGSIGFLDPVTAGPRQQALRGLRAWDIVQSALTVPLLDTIDELAVHPGRGSLRLAEAFAALADSYSLGLAHGAFSFRSHAEAFFAWARPTKDVRPAFAARLDRERETLRPVVEQRLAGMVSPSAAAWRTAFAYSAGTLDNTVTEGRLTLEMLDALTDGLDRTAMGPPTAEDVVPTGKQPDTSFHRTLENAGVLDGASQWFAAYRVLINLFYQQLPLLTVSPLQRYYTCYAIAELVDEVLGESWQDRLTRTRVRVPEGRQS
jgi:hypothetical protein